MRTIKYITIILSALLALAACTSDHKTQYIPANVVPGELNEISGSYVLDRSKDAEVLETFAWGEIDFGYPAAPTYTLEVALGGTSFEPLVALSTVGGKGEAMTSEITVKMMNAALLKLLAANGIDITNENEVEKEFPFEFRIKGSISNAENAKPIYTNTISSSITPYAGILEYPFIWLTGDYAGWSWERGKTLRLFDFAESGELFQAWIFFDGKAQNGFKITETNDWANPNWGVGASAEDEARSLILELSGGDIKAYSGDYYHFSFNPSTAELKVNKTLESFGIVGDFSSWGDNPDLQMIFDPIDQTFTIPATAFPAGKIKFRSNSSWDGINLGGTDGVLTNGGDDIPLEAGTYKITVDMNNPDNMLYTIEGAVELNPDNISSPVMNVVATTEIFESTNLNLTWTQVDFNGQEPAPVSYELWLDLKGANFANAISLTNLRDQGEYSIKGTDLLAKLEALGVTNPLGQSVELETKVVARVSGIDQDYPSETQNFVITVLEDLEGMYMIGNAFGDWNWGSEDIVMLIPVHGKDNAYWTIKYLEKGQGFKWSPKRDWGDDFVGLSENEGFIIGTDNNPQVEVSGLYMIYIEVESITSKTGKVVIEQPKVYGLGDAFGSWDQGAHPLALSADGKTMSITVSGEGETELRLYVKPSKSTTDWWTSEFMLFDGKIEYRGNGGDQARVKVSKGQVVTLDFQANTGSIQ